MAEPSDLYARIRAMVQRIPVGSVATYGDIAEFVTGTPRNARLVGYAMAGLTEAQARDVPWWRVINARGTISPRGDADAKSEEKQRALLEAEGVPFDEHGRVDLQRYAWDGDDNYKLPITNDHEK